MARPGQIRKPDAPKKLGYVGVSRRAFTKEDILRARLSDDDLIAEVRRRLLNDGAAHAVDLLDALSVEERRVLAARERRVIGRPLAA